MGPEFSGAVEDTYRRGDEVVGRALGFADDETLVIVLSDHGFGSYRNFGDLFVEFGDSAGARVTSPSGHDNGDGNAIGGNTGFELEATTFSGNVRSDIPLTLRAGEAASRDGRGPRLNRAIHGSFGDASAIVILQSFSGDITVTKR